jgi:haloacetate dehalogenase
MKWIRHFIAVPCLKPPGILLANRPIKDFMPNIINTWTRRALLKRYAAASIGTIIPTPWFNFLQPQTLTDNKTQHMPNSEFQSSHIKVGENDIFFRRYGNAPANGTTSAPANGGTNAPAILMVHGFPRTSLMWRHLAPKFAADHTVICVDLRAYGQSGIPRSTDDHFPYSKRAMAVELVSLMEKLGFPTFTLVGHDRGGRVSYRMALDHPDRIEKLAVFDVIPILEAWSRTDARFARTYWPWILLAQQSPLPESYLLGAPKAVFENAFGHGTFGADILDQYLKTYRDPARVHGICEEYRAAATIDIEHDQADKDAKKQIQCPMLHLWAEGGPLDTFYGKDGGSLGIWRQWAPLAQGQKMRGGHFFPEENPDDTATLLKGFLNA